MRLSNTQHHVGIARLLNAARLIEAPAGAATWRRRRRRLISCVCVGCTFGHGHGCQVNSPRYFDYCYVFTGTSCRERDRGEWGERNGEGCLRLCLGLGVTTENTINDSLRRATRLSEVNRSSHNWVLQSPPTTPSSSSLANFAQFSSLWKYLSAGGGKKGGKFKAMGTCSAHFQHTMALNLPRKSKKKQRRQETETENERLEGAKRLKTMLTGGEGD